MVEQAAWDFSEVWKKGDHDISRGRKLFSSPSVPHLSMALCNSPPILRSVACDDLYLFGLNFVRSYGDGLYTQLTLPTDLTVYNSPLQTGQILTIAEEIVGPYIWGHYDLLILPPSGRMENPCLTFVSPTVLVSFLVKFIIMSSSLP